MKIRRILHATDFSPASRPALDLAREMAKAFAAELILFHAAEVIMPIGVGPAAGYVPPAVINDVWKAAREQAAGEMQRVARIARAGDVRVTTMIADGPAAQAVVRAAERRRAGLIVLGTHGRTGVKRFLLGSVAERVVRTARQPVLTVAGS